MPLEQTQAARVSYLVKLTQTSVKGLCAQRVPTSETKGRLRRRHSTEDVFLDRAGPLLCDRSVSIGRRMSEYPFDRRNWLSLCSLHSKERSFINMASVSPEGWHS